MSTGDQYLQNRQELITAIVAPDNKIGNFAVLYWSICLENYVQVKMARKCHNHEARPSKSTERRRDEEETMTSLRTRLIFNALALNSKICNFTVLHWNIMVWKIHTGEDTQKMPQSRGTAFLGHLLSEGNIWNHRCTKRGTAFEWSVFSTIEKPPLNAIYDT